MLIVKLRENAAAGVPAPAKDAYDIIGDIGQQLTDGLHSFRPSEALAETSKPLKLQPFARSSSMKELRAPGGGRRVIRGVDRQAAKAAEAHGRQLRARFQADEHTEKGIRFLAVKVQPCFV